jgi:hypothetical protein
MVSMLSFIVCTGGIGDGAFASWGRAIFGGGRANAVERIYNRDYDPQQWREVLEQQQVALQFLEGARDAAIRKLARELAPPDQSTNPQAGLFKLFGDPQYQEMTRRPIAFSPSDAVKTMEERAVEFLIWQHEADRLGIHLSDKDVNHELNVITGNKLSKNDLAQLVSDLRMAYSVRNRGQIVTAESIFAGIASEFRARMAQEAMLGEPSRPGIDSAPVPAPVTPDDFWKYYQANASRFTVNLVPIAVEDFLDQVKEKPTEAELKKLYEQYKNADYSPEVSTPGFKQPARFGVEWVSGKADTPYYKEEVKRANEAILATQKVLSGAFLPEGGVGQSATSIAFNTTVETQLLRDYDDLKFSYRQPNWIAREFWRPPLHESSLNQPVNVVSMVGQLAGSNGSPSSLLNGAISYLSNAQQRETEDRLKIGTTWILNSATGPGPLPAAIVTAWAVPERDFAPFSELRDEILKRVVEDRSRSLLVDHFSTVEGVVRSEAPAIQAAKLIGLVAPPNGPLLVAADPRPRTLLSHLVSEYHLSTGRSSSASLDQPANVASLVGQFLGANATPAPLFDGVIGPLAVSHARGLALRDQYNIAADPGLAPFKEAALIATPNQTRDPANADLNFARLFSHEGTFQPETSPWLNGKVDSFVYWRNQEQPAKVVPFDNPEVRREVEKAWRLQKARALALDYAKKQEIAIRETAGDKLKVKDFGFKLNKPVIELPGLAKQVATPSIEPTSQAQRWGKPTIPQDKVARSGNKFVQDIVQFQDKKIGDTMILQDQPERTVYVAILVDREQDPVRDRLAFYEAYKEGTAPTTGQRSGPTLFSMFLDERRKKYVREFVDKLKAEANYKKIEKTPSTAPSAPVEIPDEAPTDLP